VALLGKFNVRLVEKEEEEERIEQIPIERSIEEEIKKYQYKL